MGPTRRAEIANRLTKHRKSSAMALVRRNPPYIKHGGVPVDVTDRIHPLTASQAVAAAKFMQIDVAGLDVVAVDIGRPLEEQGGVFVEINTGPGLWLHLAPYIESPRSVGTDIVDMLFAPGEDGRIPVVAVVGETSDLATNHLVRLLAQSGVRAASASEKEIVMAGRSYVPQGNSPQSRAAALFQNETVDTAILKTTPQELFHAGFGNDHCDVALIIDSILVECTQALRNALSPNGILVLEAEQHDPAFSAHLPVERIIRFAVNERIARLEEHLLAGGTGVYVQDARIILSQWNQPPILLGCIPAGISVQDLRMLLASLGAAMSLGQRIESLRVYVDSLVDQQPGVRSVDTVVRPLISRSCSSPLRMEPIIFEACRRNLPATVLSIADRRFLRLGQGSKQHRCQGIEPDTVNAVAQMASSDKQLCKHLLTEAGVPVPLGRVAHTAEQAWSTACDLGLPVAIKPVDGGSDSGVSLDLRTREQVETAFFKAELVDKEVLIERFVSGQVFRVTVAGDRVLAVSLVKRPTLPHTAMGDTRDPHTDLSHMIHPDTSAQAIAAVHAVRLSVADVEVIAHDIAKRLEEQGGVVIGVSSGRLVDWGSSCDPVEQDTLAQEIVTSLFPQSNDGRIPVVAILDDTSGATTAHLAAMLALAGLCAGTAGDSEITIAERRWTPAGNSPSERARVVFQSPIVDVALLKLSRCELIRLGMGNDVCNVAIVLDSVAIDIASGASEIGIALNAFPQPEINGLGSIEKLLPTDISGTGILVLPLDLRLSRAEQSMPANRIIWFAAREDIASSSVRLVEGERVVFVEADYFVLAEGSATRVKLGKRPANIMGDELAPILAAALALGLKIEMLKDYLARLDFTVSSYKFLPNFLIPQLPSQDACSTSYKKYGRQNG